jgi:hypothetical protein
VWPSIDAYNAAVRAGYGKSGSSTGQAGGMSGKNDPGYGNPGGAMTLSAGTPASFRTGSRSTTNIAAARAAVLRAPTAPTKSKVKPVKYASL